MLGNDEFIIRLWNYGQNGPFFLASVHQMHIYERIPAAAGMHETVTFMGLN